MGPAISIGQYYPDNTSRQRPCDAAVVIPTILRPCLVDAVRSVFAQQFEGRIQILIGVDVAKGEIDPVIWLLEQRPDRVSVLMLNLPYSTSTLNGGLHEARDGGATRTMASFMANSRYVAYLDDDNTWAEDHLSVLHEAIQGHAWAASERILVDELTGEKLCVDRWDSVGTDRGRFAATGGMVDPNCLMVDKLKVADALSKWTEPSLREGRGADRNFFRAIARRSHVFVNRPTVFYNIRPTNVLWKFMRDNVKF